MKLKTYLLLVCSVVLFSCSNSENSPEFITQTSGRYLYNSDEIMEVYFQENDLFLKWHGAEKIKPMKLEENSFFVKEMNEKIRFLSNPADQLMYISLVSKEKKDSITYHYRKLNPDENIPSYYLNNNSFDKALNGYLAIKEKDSLDPIIEERHFNRKGYDALGNGNTEKAMNIFKINAALYPNSSNVYDSLGEALMKSGDTVQAIDNYKKSLALDSGNNHAKRMLKRLEKKE